MSVSIAQNLWALRLLGSLSAPGMPVEKGLAGRVVGRTCGEKRLEEQGMGKEGRERVEKRVRPGKRGAAREGERRAGEGRLPEHSRCCRSSRMELLM